jgi:cytochrome P450
MSPAPVHVDPPEHARFRELLKPRLSPQGVSRLEPFVRSKVNQLIDSFEARQGCEYQQDFAVPLPCSVVLHLLGVPGDDLDVLLSIKDEIMHPEGKTPANEARRHGAARASEYFGKALDERMARPAEDLLTDLGKAVTEGRFNREEILRVCLNLVLGGLDTVTASLGCAMAYLAQNRDQRRLLVNASRASIARTARELMRTQAPVTVVPRRAMRDVTVAGTEIRAGTLVMLLLGGASADDEMFPDAGRVDLARHPNPHVAFGAGRHRCIGERLANVILEVALQEWHRRIPEYAIAGREKLTYSAVVRAPKMLPLEWGARAAGDAG